MSSSLVGYYGKRANEYERIYRKPERQADLTRLTQLLQEALAGHDVLEIACGTGFWTAACAPVVTSLLATDASPEVLALAHQKPYPRGRVRLAVADAYALDDTDERFTAALAAFWWSHIPHQRLPGFLHTLHRRLGAGARVVFCDNRYVEGSSTPLSRRDQSGNSYQRRWLDDGTEYEVLKNFPAGTDVCQVLRSQGAIEVVLTELTFYWCVTYLIGTALP